MSTAETDQTREYSDRHKHWSVSTQTHAHWNLARLSREAMADNAHTGDMRGVARLHRLTRQHLRLAGGFMISRWLRRHSQRQQREHYAEVVANIPLETDDELRSHLCLETDPNTRLALSCALSERLSAHDAYEHLTGKHRSTWTGVRGYCGEDTGPSTAPMPEVADWQDD